MDDDCYEEMADVGSDPVDDGARRISSPGIVRPPGARVDPVPDTIWEGLVTGQFSLVEQFERDGRTYLVARRNDPRGPALTSRERTLVAWAARGLSNSEIAGETGLSQATIAAHLANAAQKLGVASRAALVNAAAAFVDQEPGFD